MRLFRLLKIASVASRYGLDEMVLEHEPTGRLVRLANTLQFWRDLSAPRAVRLRMALEVNGGIGCAGRNTAQRLLEKGGQLGFDIMGH